MTHRDVSISLFGIVAGVILGAGSLTWVQTADLGATTVSFLNEDLHPSATETYNKRTVNRIGVPLRKQIDVNRYPTVKKDETAPPAAVDTMTVITPCIAAQRTVWKIKNVYTTATPMNVSNTAIRQQMDDVFADALDDYCDPVASSSSAAAAATPGMPVVDNDCEKYPSHTVRYSQCVLAEKIGKKYP